MPIGPGKSTAGLGGNIPQLNREGYTKLRQKMLFYSDRAVALLLPKTMKGGFGNLEAGLPLANMYDADNNKLDKLVPYAAAMDWSDIDVSNDPARVLLQASASATDTKIYVDATQVGRFDEDEAVILAKTGPTYEEAVITSIDDEYSSVLAEITLSGELSNAFATTDSACVYHKSHTSSGGNAHLSKAVGIMDQDVGTGDAENPSGAQTSLFVSGGILVTNALQNMDSQALTDLGATEDGMYTIFK